MHPTSASIEGIEPPPAGHALRWWVDALRLWRRAPLRFLIACFIPIVVEGVLQMIPLAGMILSKVAITLVGAGLYLVMDGLSRTGRMSWQGMLWGLRARNLVAALQLAAIMLCVVVVDMTVVFAVYGLSGLDAALLGRGALHPGLVSRTFALTLILPGLVPATLLLFAAPLVVLDGVPPLRAAGLSIRWFVSAPLAFAVTTAILLSLVGVSLTWGYGLGLLVALPWLSALGYAAYADVFGRNAGERFASARESTP